MVGPGDYYVSRKGIAEHVKGIDSLCQRLARHSSLANALTTFRVHEGYKSAHRSKVLFFNDGSSHGAQLIANLGYDDFQRANTIQDADGTTATLGLDETTCDLSSFYHQSRRVPLPYSTDLVESEGRLHELVGVRLLNLIA